MTVDYTIAITTSSKHSPLAVIGHVAKKSFVAFCLTTLLTSCLSDHRATNTKSPSERNGLERTVDKLKKYGDGSMIDSDVDLSRDEFENAMYTRDGKGLETFSKSSAPEIPDISDILLTPQPPQIGEDKLVSLSVTEDVPLKDVLIELARLADIDAEVDPQITGGIILRVKDKPLNQVIDRIAYLAKLRYSLDNGTLRVERDIPYIENYRVDFLNLARSGTSDTSITTSVLNSVEGANSNSTVNSGTQSKLASKHDGDLWVAVENDIKKILDISATDATTTDGSATNGDISLPTSTTGTPSAATAGGAGSIDSTISGTEPAIRPMNNTFSPEANSAFLAMNKQAGMVTIRATKRQHDIITRYLDKIRQAASAQVLIEAKIVEVTLDKKYRAGINWNLARGNLTLGADFMSPVQSETDLFNIGVLGTELNAAVSLTDQFGTSRTLSSPRLNTMNNQQAVLSFAVNQVYFKLKVDREQNTSNVTDTDTLSVDSEIRTVPIGVILTLQPSINMDTNEITMSIRPTLSRITDQVSDPGVSLIASQNNSNVTSFIPVVEVRELDSVLKIKSGQVMVIGGLMEERSVNNDAGIPIMGTLPVVGGLFKSQQKDTNTVETVIFIKATIVPTEKNTVSDPDKIFYKKFTRDPRPLTF